MLQLDQITATAGDFTLTADLTLPETGRIAVIGPSGAGKSTLLDLLAGFRTPDTGALAWQGKTFGFLPPAQRPFSVLFQDNNLFPHLTLERNLALALRPTGGAPTQAERSAISQALDQVGLAGFETRTPGALSGGQQSRAALARVLLQKRPILLLDEPFAALGPALKSEMLALVEQLATDLRALVILVTHDPQDARRFATQTILVNNGQVSPPQDTETLFANPPEALRAYLGT